MGLPILYLNQYKCFLHIKISIYSNVPNFHQQRSQHEMDSQRYTTRGILCSGDQGDGQLSPSVAEFKIKLFFFQMSDINPNYALNYRCNRL